MDVSMADIQAALDAVQGAFKEAPAQGGSIYDPPPDGDYQALTHEFGFHGWEAKDGRPAGIGFKVNYQVTNNAAYAGRICGAMFNISDPERIGYLKGWLTEMGVDTEAEGFDLKAALDPSGETLARLLDVPVMIRVKRSGGYVNVYLQQRLGDQVISDVTPPTAQQDFALAPAAGSNAVYQHGDEDIPFKWDEPVAWLELKATRRA